MFVSIACYGVHIRPPRVHVPAFADSYLPGVTVALKAGQSTYNWAAADCLQRPLRFRFRQRLRRSVRRRTPSLIADVIRFGPMQSWPVLI
jgi:hypothetical protein